MTASKIRPPRRPRGEKPAVTIANQAREIKLLMESVERHNLWWFSEEKRRIKLEAMLAKTEADRAQIEQENDRLTMQLADMRKAYTRLEGWRDCALELFPALAAKLDR